MASWVTRNSFEPEHLAKLHDPIGYAKTFGLKKPLVFCANEDCVYKANSSCPAGSKKKNCPNRSALDYNSGCPHFYGREYQYGFLKDSMSGQYRIITDVTGRGTGKSAIKDTQKVLMEATTEPLVRQMLYKTPKPVPVKIIVVGNTKETSLLLRQSIRGGFESSDALGSFIDPKNDTKTHIRTVTGADIYFKTAGVDGRGLRGFHADIIKNIKDQDVKTTIIFIFDEAWFTRAHSVIQEVMEPSLQIGNTYSQILVTTTPYNDRGEVAVLRKTKKKRYKHYSFASYHNKYSDLESLMIFRERCISSGQGSVYNREVLGRPESDEDIFMPFRVWVRGISESIEWTTEEDMKKMQKMPGLYYCGVDPNKFRQLRNGDFASYVLLWVSPDRSYVRAVAIAKYQLDLDDDFKSRLKMINEIYEPRWLVDQNSGYKTTLGNMGFNVRNASNDRQVMNPAMRLFKEDIVDGVFKMPASDQWEEERRVFITKEDGVGPIPKLDHKGTWGQGYSSDLMRCVGYAYIGIMQDFNIDMDQYSAPVESINQDDNVIPIDAMRKRSSGRMSKVVK